MFANFGRIVTVTPVNYLRDRGDFIDPAAPGGEARYLAGAGLLALETINVPTAGRNAISVGSGRNVLFGGMGDDSIRAAGGFNLMAGNAAQALYTAAGRILSFASTFPSQGGNNSLYNNGEGVMIGGVGNDVLESGAGSNVMFGDNGRVTFVNDRFSVAETLDIAYGGDDILLAGTGGNFMLGGRGSDMFRGSFSKDVMVGDFAAIYFDLSGSRVVNLTRFGGRQLARPDHPFAGSAVFPGPARMGHAPHPVFERAWTQRSVAFLSAGHAAQDGGRVSVAPERPDIVIERHDGGISIYAAGDAAPGVVSMRGGADASDAGRSMAPSGPAGTEAPGTARIRNRIRRSSSKGGRPTGRSRIRVRGRPPARRRSAVRAPDRAPDERAALAAGVGVLGLSGALGATGSVVFNSKTNTWENKARRKTGVRMIRQDMPLEEAQALSEDE